MIRIFLSNITLIITDDCPDDMAACAIRTLCNRGIPGQVECDFTDDIYPHRLPRYSPFIGQLGAQLR